MNRVAKDLQWPSTDLEATRILLLANCQMAKVFISTLEILLKSFKLFTDTNGTRSKCNVPKKIETMEYGSHKMTVCLFYEQQLLSLLKLIKGIKCVIKESQHLVTNL